MRRRAFDLAAMVSLLLCVATVGLWVHSTFRAVSLGYAGSRDAGGFIRTWEIGSTRGAICWTIVWHWSNSFVNDEGLRWSSDPPAPSVWLWMPSSTHRRYGVSTQDDYGMAGLFFERFRALPVGWDRHVVQIPDWFLIVVLLVLPAMRWVPRRRPAPGCCRTCGYDLRATPAQSGALLDRCPECGAVPMHGLAADA